MSLKRNGFAKTVFLVAGGYGLLALVPQYFMEGVINRNFPPPLTHPEQFYGFIGVSLAWQFVFFVIAIDVVRFRVFILPAVLEKISFGVATAILFVEGRVPRAVVYAG